MANEKPISKGYLLTQLKNYETEIINKKYIEKEDGKGLSSNDYTTEEKNKLAGLENYNDTALSNRVKSVEDEVPNLATKTYVGEQIANAEHLKREIVTVLPSDTEASDNIIYMLKVESTTGNDKYQEYMKIDGTIQMVGDTSVDLTDYAKTADIPTTLPANGGNADTVNNHTVETDVPTDAVFTDTIYDDTEVKESIEELSSNLDQLSYGETVGGANIWNEKWELGIWDIETGEKIDNSECIRSVDYIPVEPNTNYVFVAPIGTPIRFFFSNSNKEYLSLISGTLSETYFNFTTPNDAHYMCFYYGGKTYANNTAIIKGTSGTYKPYIPSVKMLSDKATQIDDLNVLGWVVPEEMPIKNYVDSDGVFHQKVGRVDLGSLDWFYNNTYLIFYSIIADGKFTGTVNGIENAFCIKYNTTTESYVTFSNNSISVGNFVMGEDLCGITIKDTSFTDATTFKNAMQGVYLYYELAEEILIKVDGNEAVTRVNDSLGDYNIDNKCGELVQGYWSDSLVLDKTLKDVCCSTPIDCNGGDIVTVKTSEIYTIYLKFFDANNNMLLRTSASGKSLTATAPNGTEKYIYIISSENKIFPQTVGHIGVYVNNEIDVLKQDLEALTNYRTEKTLIGKFCGLNHYRNVYTGVISPSSGTINIPHGIATSEEIAYATNFSAYGCKIFPELDGRAYIIDLKNNVWFELSSGSSDITLKYPDSENCEFNYTIIIEYAIKE